MNRSIKLLSLCIVLGVLAVLASVEAAPRKKRQILGAILEGLLGGGHGHGGYSGEHYGGHSGEHYGGHSGELHGGEYGLYGYQGYGNYGGYGGYNRHRHRHPEEIY